MECATIHGINESTGRVQPSCNPVTCSILKSLHHDDVSDRNRDHCELITNSLSVYTLVKRDARSRDRDLFQVTRPPTVPLAVHCTNELDFHRTRRFHCPRPPRRSLCAHCSCAPSPPPRRPCIHRCRISARCCNHPPLFFAPCTRAGRFSIFNLFSCWRFGLLMLLLSIRLSYLWKIPWVLFLHLPTTATPPAATLHHHPPRPSLPLLLSLLQPPSSPPPSPQPLTL